MSALTAESMLVWSMTCTRDWVVYRIAHAALYEERPELYTAVVTDCPPVCLILLQCLHLRLLVCDYHREDAGPDTAVTGYAKAHHAVPVGRAAAASNDPSDCMASGVSPAAVPCESESRHSPSPYRHAAPATLEFDADRQVDKDGRQREADVAASGSGADLSADHERPMGIASAQAPQKHSKVSAWISVLRCIHGKRFRARVTFDSGLTGSCGSVF